MMAKFASGENDLDGDGGEEAPTAHYRAVCYGQSLMKQITSARTFNPRTI